MSGKKLTPKQERFVDEYLVDLNGTQAAIRAGYSKKTAGEIASQNLKKLEIQHAVTVARADLAERAGVTQEMIVEELKRVGFSDRRDLMSWTDRGMRFIPSAELTEAQAAVVSGVKSKTTTRTDEKGIQWSTTELELKTYDKLSALDKLGKHLGMFVQRVEHSGQIEHAIKVEEVDGARERLFETLTGIATRLMESHAAQAVNSDGDGRSNGVGTQRLLGPANGTGEGTT